MHNLTLIEAERLLQPEPPSYFEYHARRTLPGDKKLMEIRKTLNRWYFAADVEHILRGMIAKGAIQKPIDEDAFWSNHE